MRQRNHLRGEVSPPLEGIGQCRTVCRAESKPLRVLSDQQREPDRAHLCQQLMVPACRAFGSWWQVTTWATAWETETHRHEGNFCIVVKGRIVDVEPGAQAGTARVAPWNTRRMHPCAGRLADDQNSRAFGRRDYRAWGMRQEGRADRA